MKVNKTVLIIILNVFFYNFSFCAEIQPAQSSSWDFPSQKTVLQTALTGFHLQGKKRSQSIYIFDFDIVITEDNSRLVPLFRLLRLLGANGQVQYDNLITFQVEAGPKVKLNAVEQSLHVENRNIPVEIKIGNSDVTGRGEMYVSEKIIKEAFGFDFNWSEENYEYTLNTDKSLELFNQNRPGGQSLLSAKVQEPSSSLYETEPDVYSDTCRSFFSFIQPQLRVDSQYHLVRDERHVETVAHPALTLWGNFSSGIYRIKLSQTINYPNAKIPSIINWLDEGVWTSKEENMITKVGDTNFGCSELVAPGTSVFGASVKWISPQKEKDVKYDRYLKRRSIGYLSEDNFEGLAQLGATVELWVNNILIQTKIVEEPAIERAGYGIYRFNSVGLLEKALNEIKIVIKRKDGMVEEYYKQILGTTALLPAGSWAILGGAGTRRQKNLTETVTEGVFFASQVNYGLTKAVTLGLTVAAQNKFALLLDTTGSVSRSPESYNVGQQVNIRLLDKLLLKEEAAKSIKTADDTNAGAYKLGIEYYFKKIKLESQLFSYAPGYMNGLTDISDRRGYSAFTRWPLLKKLSMNLMGLRVHNNIDHSEDYTKTEDIVSLSLSFPGLIPKTDIRLGTFYTDLDNLTGMNIRSITRTYIADMNINFTNDLNMEVRHVFGDKSGLQETEDLAYGLSVPGIDQYFSRGTRVRTSYSINPRNAVSSMYWKTDSQRQAEVSYEHKYYNSEGKNTWDSRIDLGKIISTGKFYSHGNMEFKIDESGYNRVGLEADTKNNGKEYYFGFYFSLNNLFSISEGKFKKVTQFGISPEMGGVEGFVYLDKDGNGHRGADEPGLPNIPIMMNGRSYGESDQNGNFFISCNPKKEFVTVSLDEYSLPAIYIPTQGKQKVYWKEGIFSKANLGLCVTNAVSGEVSAYSLENTKKRFPGLRVMLLMADDKKTLIRDSVTGSDGSFYIGEIKPGNYMLDIDIDSVPVEYKPIGLPRELNIVSGAEPGELKDFNILLIKKE
ncbi:MAG: hypothetical protein PHX78_09860 [bacterium]|nr:hypothetical protein [bacterium]